MVSYPPALLKGFSTVLQSFVQESFLKHLLFLPRLTAVFWDVGDPQLTFSLAGVKP